MSRGIGRQTRDLIAAATRILAEQNPTTVRGVCYQLFRPYGLIASMTKRETNRVSRALVTARERGMIPWHWIVDESRAAEGPASWDDANQFIAHALSQYRRDRWRDQPRWVEVWSEKSTVAGTLRPVLDGFGVGFRVLHGYGSATLVNDVAQLTVDRTRQLSVLYVGDWDPSGLHMSEVDLPRRLGKYGAAVALHRVALVRGDLDGLSPFPLADKAADPRHGWFARHHGAQCWELDAMPAPALRERVRASIAGMIDVDRWQRAAEVEAAEAESMRRFQASWPASKSGHAPV